MSVNRSTAVIILIGVFAIVAPMLISRSVVAQDFSGSGGGSPFAGTWQPDSLQAQITLVIDGTTVTGSVSQGATVQPITKGAVRETAISFSVESPDGQRSVTFTGTLTGKTIAFTRTVIVHPDGGPGGNGIFGATGPAAFTVTRSPIPGSLSGRVTEIDSRKPIPKAVVHVFRPVGAGRGSEFVPVTAMVETAADGAFTVTGLPPGNYKVAVTADHFVEQEYGQPLSGGRGSLVTVRPGEELRAIDFALTKSSVIEGTVLDQSGAPMAGIEVQAFVFSFTPDSGARNIEEIGDSRTTDDRGRYRLGDLNPGEYLVMARPAPSPMMRGAMRGAGNAPYREMVIPTFYPGVRDPAGASLVTLSPGAHVRGMDFAVVSMLASRLTGTVVLPSDHVAASASTVFLLPIAIPGETPAARSVATGSDGAFQFFGIVPGPYRIVAVSGDREMTAIHDLEIASGATPTVSLALRRGVDLAGQIYADGATPPDFRPEDLTVDLRLASDLEEAFGLRNVWTTVSADGSFVLRSVIPDARYHVMFGKTRQSRSDAYLVAGRYGDTDPLNAPITIAADDNRLQLQIGFTPGRVEVTTTDQERPRPGIVTVLVPRERARRDQYQVVESDAEGRAVFERVPPGEYKLFAWEDVRQGRWFDAEFMQRVEDRGRPIRVDRGGTSTSVAPIIKSETEALK